jgi:diaminohydroxyphosphoribosylaminopyrimidine deaminase / 5-amino-6-(5-phosphoribosylamino)uracil reductase
MTPERDPERDAQWMAMALAEAVRAQPSPNPPVGAVLVSPEGELVARAHHERTGQPHAEELVLAEAGDAARGATMYVSLEPCNHDGLRPPCVDAIVRAGIARVVVGCEDPNPNVEGGGVGRLRAEGVVVDVGILSSEAKAVIGPWTTFITQGRPHVALKLALSLDGRIATRTGASKWVTGPEARTKVQELRAQRDAVAVGIGTVVTDDPRLTVREAPPELIDRIPARIIFDSHLRVPLGSRVVQTAGEIRTILLACADAPADAEQALVDHGATVIRLPSSAEGRVDVTAALRTLASNGMVTLLVEGGAELAGSLLAARLADELHAFIAPILLGPRGRPGAVDWAGPDTPTDAPRIADPQWEVCGRDAYVFGVLSFPAAKT